MPKDIHDWESEWRAEFERYGEDNTRDSLRGGFFQEAKRQFAYRWLGDRALERAKREARMLRYVKYTLWAAVAAVFVGIVGIAVTLLR
jgi:hypothetical protein